MKKILLLLFTGFLLSFYANAQSTFEGVHQILQTSCTGCHGGSSPAAKLDLSGDLADVYKRLLDQDIINPVALEKGYKLVKPGYPDQSSLYRKVNAGLYHESELLANEGKVMPPNNLPTLADAEKELIRQWIYFGAPETGKVINEEILEEYYTLGGLPRVERPEAPAVGEGFQIHLGSIFLAPQEEREYILKHALNNEEELKIKKLEVVMNSESHHFLLFAFDPGADLDEDEGLEEITILSTLTGEAISITNDTKMFGGWVYDAAYELPDPATYTWDANTVLKFNYHLRNYSNTAIMPSDVYINVYTQPKKDLEYKMESIFDVSPISELVIPPGEHTFEWVLRNFENTSSEDSIHIWQMGAHTHQYGTDFDVYLRNADGSRGEQVYEGFYNFDYSFDQGYYDYAEPPSIIFDQLLSIKAKDGLILEATYNNTTEDFVTFGLTTKDEMFGVFLQYLVGDVSEIEGESVGVTVNDVLAESAQLQVYPNPVQTVSQINYQLETAEEVALAIYDIKGQKVAQLVNEKQAAGLHQQKINVEELQLQAGTYFITLMINGQSTTKRIVVGE